MVIHLVLESCVVMAFSSSSKVLFFFNFLTKDLTAFSDHFSSCSFLGSPLRQPSRRFTIGGVKGNMELMPLPRDYEVGQAYLVVNFKNEFPRQSQIILFFLF